MISSEIEESGQPYKSIEAIINNNRMILRIQKLPVQLQPEESSTTKRDGLEESFKHKSEAKSTYYPQPYNELPFPIPQNVPIIYSSQKSRDEQMNTIEKPIENPNIFLLKIRKRSETRDRKKENIDLEFRTPRPWPKPIPKPIPKKPSIIEETLLDVKQSEIIIEEKKEEPAPLETMKKNERENKEMKKKNIKKKKKGKKKKKKKK
ncbi:hypothetical protein PV327_001443 [Microctonus hyperodae]|uniref:Uncharacterized protein n=1 Tax=Microctonus hyperodae TaxID=165561 RepID=A0AA39G8A9_MICHY|nr:hypothetical protein PV327_001443 [Microctonus hyperodae]